MGYYKLPYEIINLIRSFIIDDKNIHYILLKKIHIQIKLKKYERLYKIVLLHKSKYKLKSKKTCFIF